MGSRTLAVFAGIAAALSFSAAQAARTVTDEVTGTQGKYRYRLDLLGKIDRDRDAGTVSRGAQPEAILSVVVFENADLQIGTGYLRVHSDGPGGPSIAKGALDTSIDLKWWFYDQGPLSIGIKPGITLPTGRAAPDWGTGRVTWGGVLLVAYDWGPMTFYADAGYRRNRNTYGDRESLGYLAAAMAYRPSDRLRFVADITRDTNPDPANRTPLRYAVLRAVRTVAPDVDLEVGVKRGLSSPAIDSALLFGVTLRW